MARTSPSQQNFNAGELSPLFAGRMDMAKYGNGCAEMANAIPLPQGPARRRPGTRFTAEVKNSNDRCWLARFVFSEDDAFTLEFGDGYIRFFTDNGQLTAGSPAAYDNAATYTQGNLVTFGGVTYYSIGTVSGIAPTNATYWYPLTNNLYEIPSPYSAAELTNASNGTFRLSLAQTGDVIFMSHRNHFPKKLIRYGNTDWRIEEASISNGPFIGVNGDETVTVYSSASSGNVTLTASSSIFTAEKVGTLFLLESKAIDDVKAWEVAKTITAGLERRSDSNVYVALNAATTGSVKPVHREGAKFDGDNGVQWQYVHSGYGIARITSVSGTTATATVLSPIPSQAVGSGNATLRWSFAAWDSTLGYPDLVAFFRERLVFARGSQLWFSVAGDLENFASRDGAETLPDSAISLEIASGQINDAVWMSPAEGLLVGTKGAEFSISEVSSSDVFGPGNVQAREETAYGSRQVAPVRVGESLIFVQPTGRRVRDLRYSFNVNGYEGIDLTIIADHIATGQIVQMAYAQEPHSIVWCACANGDLIALTFMLEQDVIGWHPHPMVGAVESVVSIPAPDGSYDQVWMIVRRTIDGQTKRYVEYMEKEWVEAEDAIEDAVFSDSCSTFDGAIAGASVVLSGGTTWTDGDTGTATAMTPAPAAGDVGDYLVLTLGGQEARVEVLGAWSAGSFPVRFVTGIPVALRGVAITDVKWARDVITGLDYLEGEEVTILADGGALPRQTVTGGQVTLDNPYSKVQVGLPADFVIQTMRIEAGATDGTAQGKIKRIHRVVFRLLESLGGKCGIEGREDPLPYRIDTDPANNPPPVFTGDIKMLYPEGYTLDGQVRIVNDQPLPMTLIAIYPQMVTEGS